MARPYVSDTHPLDFEHDHDLFPDFGYVADPDFWIPELGGATNEDDDDDVLFGSHNNEGLRVTGFDSDSDSDYGNVVPGFGIMNVVESESDCDEDGVPEFGIMNLVDSGSEDGVPGFGVMNLVDSGSEDGVPGFGVMNLVDSGSENDSGLRWEGLGAPSHEEWEEVDEDAQRDELVALGVIEDIFESSEVYAEEYYDDGDDEDHDVVEEEDDPTLEAIRNLEWEMLLADNALERDSILEPDAHFDSYLAVHYDEHGGHVYAMNQEAALWEFEDATTVSPLKGSPPAAKSVVENLPLVELRNEGQSNVVCAVCKDGVLPDEKVRKLPCCHYYHQECIFPWLGIRNTCPICRYELATDDPEYERRRARGAAPGAAREPQVSSNFELVD